MSFPSFYGYASFDKVKYRTDSLFPIPISEGVEIHTCFSSAILRRGQLFRRYCSRYFGKRVAKENSSVKEFALSSFVKGSTFH